MTDTIRASDLAAYRLITVWPAGSPFRITLVAAYSRDLHSAAVARLTAAGLSEYLRDPDDEIVLGPSRVVSLFGAGELGPMDSYPVDGRIGARKLSPAVERAAGRIERLATKLFRRRV